MDNKRVKLKNGAKTLIQQNGMKVYLTAALYISVALILSELTGRLSRMDAAMDKMMQFAEAGIEPDLNDIMNMVPQISVFASVLLLGVMLASDVLSVGYTSWCLKISRGEAVASSDLLNGFEIFFKLIAMKIIRGILIMLGFVCFIVPGVILTYSFRQAEYILLDDPNCGAMASLRLSMKLMKGRKKELFILDFSFFPWYFCSNIVAELCYGIPILDIFVTPYVGITKALYYNAIRTEAASI